MNLKRKVEAGLDFVITQLFFDNRRYFEFIERARHVGIQAPIIPGIMPITNARKLSVSGPPFRSPWLKNSTEGETAPEPYWNWVWRTRPPNASSY